jgi:hypothetical protein
MKRWILVSCLVLGCSTVAWGQDAAPQAKPVKVPDQETLNKQFAESLSGSKLVGRFTVFGKEDEPAAQEEYTIASVSKLKEGDFWLFKARIKYGDKDVTLPLPLEVKWAGDTPVITLTDFTIPGMGTFSARVVIYRDNYAGWWQHGEHGGHLYGKVEKLKPDAANEK